MNTMTPQELAKAIEVPATFSWGVLFDLGALIMLLGMVFIVW